MKTEYILLVIFLAIVASFVNWLLIAREHRNLGFKMQFLFSIKELEALVVTNDRVGFERALYNHHQQVIDFCSARDDKNAKYLREVYIRIYNKVLGQLNAKASLGSILKEVEAGNEKIFKV